MADTAKWYFGLNTSDEGGGSDEGVIFDSLYEVLEQGPEYIRSELRDWQSSEIESFGEDDYDEDGFNNALESDIDGIVKYLVDEAKADPDSFYTYSFDAIGGAYDAFIMLRPASPDDIERFCDA